MTTPLPPADDVEPSAVPARPARAPARSTGWTTSDLFIGFTTVVVLISLFLPWFTATVVSGSRTLTGTISGTSSHGFLWLVFALVLTALAILIAPEALDRAPVRLPSPRQLLIGASGLSLLLVLLAFVAKPAATTVGSPAGFAGLQLQVGTTFSWSYGAFTALIAAALAFAATIRAPRLAG